MTVVVITPAAGPVVDRDEAKAHCRVDGSGDDGLIEGYIAAAAAWLDGPGGWLGRSLLTQTLEWRAERFPACNDGEIALPFPPIASVVSVTYSDANGADQTLVVDDDWRLAGAHIAPAWGVSWPSGRVQRDAVRIRYTAGYGADPETIPAPIRQAILLLVGHWYANREAVSPDAKGELPFAVEALLSPYRVWRP